MDGTLTIRRFLPVLLFTSLLVSCGGNSNLKNNQKIIEENFLQIVDTITYKFGSFRPLPPKVGASPKFNEYSSFEIVLNDSVSYNEQIQKIIQSFLETQNDSIKKELNELNKNNGFTKFLIDKDFPKKIGRYHISLHTSKKGLEKVKQAGKVKISNFKFSDEIGYLVVEQSERNSTIAFVILFKKTDGKWEIIKREFLYET